MTPKEWASAKARIRRHLRRSKHVSDGAFRLWDELATGWAWNDPVCFPTYAALSKAMNRHRLTVARHADELVKLGLLIRKRRKRGYEFVLVDEIPEKFHDPFIDDNKGLMSTRRKSNKSVAKKPVKRQQNCYITKQEAESRCNSSELHDVTDLLHQDDHDVTDLQHGDVTDLLHVDEVHQGEVLQGKEKFINGEMREPSVRVSKTKVEGVESQTEGIHLVKSMPNEIEELMEDPWEGSPKSNKFHPKQRFPDLVPSRERGLPFPEAVKDPQSLDQEKCEAVVEGPFVETPDGVLARFRSEVEEKWGFKATRTWPDRLKPKSKLARQTKSAILDQYTPDVIRDMIRLLVWDWEIARGVCFPFRPNVAYPTLLCLIQYHKELASRIDSGFHYPSERRGETNKYFNLFVATANDDDPF